jgi:ring-1,2-phenylacetyl-CoA epoxidase subunit PaaE
VQYKKLVISKIQEEVPGFKTFEFEEGHGISYKSGQYLTFVHTTAQEEIRRSYSIISAPPLNEPLGIGVKRIQNGAFSRILTDRLKPGDILYTVGAGGFFTLPEHMQSYKQIFFLAAGSGITPVYSLIKTSLYLHPYINVVLIYSNASPAKTVFYHELKQLQEMFPENFHPQFLFSNTPDLHMARLNRELLIAFVSMYSKTQKDESLFYICGPEAYMRMCTYTLQEEQVPKENIRRENFSIEKLLPARAMPPDTELHTVRIHYAGAEYQFKVQYPDSILKAAKKLGISLPYSCETGRCGSCAAKCIKGKVWLSYNEVLTEKELANGLTLTCVGHPVGGDALLEIR